MSGPLDESSHPAMFISDDPEALQERLEAIGGDDAEFLAWMDRLYEARAAAKRAQREAGQPSNGT